MDTKQTDHLADATIHIVSTLREISAKLRAEEPDTTKRWVLACDMCRQAGADFTGNWERDPSPLQQVIEKMATEVRAAIFDHNAGTLTLLPYPVGQNSVMLPLDWFDEALLMVDSQWGVEYYPYTPDEKAAEHRFEVDPDCFSCQGTSKIVGFGNSGDDCPCLSVCDEHNDHCVVVGQ